MVQQVKMILEARIAVLLTQARAAQQQADKAHDLRVREIWLKIAEAFRELADLARSGESP